jgi:hypothetical protein
MKPSSVIQPPAARWRRLTGPAVILLAALVAVAPQLIRGNSCGHDFDYHFVAWLNCLNGWQHGIVYPHWADSGNFRAGDPRLLFYPPLTWMLGAALGAIFSWTLVPIVLTFLLLAATGLAVRALARPALDDGPATLAGCAALFSGYTLFTAYERTAFGELTGGFWVPLLLLFVLRDRNPSGSLFKRAFDGSTAPLALVVAGVWLSDAPLGVMGSYLLAAVAVTSVPLKRSLAPVLRAATATALGMGLAGLYLVPAAWEQRWVDIRQATADPSDMIENSWLFARHADPQFNPHDIVLLRVSLIAVVMLAAALAGLFFTWRRGRLPASRSWWIPLALIPFAILFLQLPISLPVWNLLPKLRLLQFPWRWMVALGAPMGIFLASAVWVTRGWRRVAVVAACTVVFLGASAAAGQFLFQTCDDEDSVASMLSIYRSGPGFEGDGEFAPPGTNSSLVATGLPAACLVRDPTVLLGRGSEETVPDWNASQGSCEATFTAQEHGPEHLRITVTTGHAGYLILRLQGFPAWRVKVNGRLITHMPRRADGLMVVPVPQGPVNLTVDWTTTPDVLGARWLSLLALLLITALFLLERKLFQTRLS